MAALRRLAAPALLLALAALVWGGALRVPYHYDDYDNILSDDATRAPAALWQRLRHGVRPLLRLSYFLDPLVFPILLAIGRPRRGALAAALSLAAAVGAGLLLSPRYQHLLRYSLELRGPLDALRINAAALPVLLSLWACPSALSIEHGFAAE